MSAARPRPSDRRRVSRALAQALALAAALAFASGYFGDIVPFFDTLAHFRAHLAVLLLLAGLALLVIRPVTAGLAAIILGAFGLFSVYPAMLPAASLASAPGGTARYTLLQMNLRWSATDRTAAIRLIGELSPDVVTLQEARKEWRPLLQSLSARYPYRFDCTGPRAYFDVVILSRRPFASDDPGDCDRPGTFASRTVDFNGQALTIATQHLTWPWPGRQWRQLGQLQDRLRRLRRLGTPVLIAGDFNAAPWSAALRTYAAASGTDIVPNVGPSWFFQPFTRRLAPYAGLPIDNILASPGIDILGVARQPATGSDHLPLLVTFGVDSALPGVVEPQRSIVERRALDD